MSTKGKAATSVWQLFQQQRRGISTMPSSTNLYDLLKRDLIERHSAAQVRDIWAEFHADPLKHRVAKVLPAATYFKFAESAARSPMFVLPVFKGPNAFENFMVQCQLPLVLFTSLEDYKRHGSSAAPHMALTHYTELAEDKGIVLVRGDIIQPQAVSQGEAEQLMRLVHEFYLDSQKYSFVHAFNHRQSEFDFKRMLDMLGHDTSRLPGA